MKQFPALFIGRFQPFHRGHLDAVMQILRIHKKIIIGIGSAQYVGLSKNPFSSDIRKKMIEASLREAGIKKKKITIVKIPDIHDDAAWVAHVEKLTPRFGTVYSGTPKVQKLFKKSGKHPVGILKFNLRISGTQVRKKTAAGEAWKHLVPKAVYLHIRRFVKIRNS